MIFGTTKKYINSSIKKICKTGKLYTSGIIVYKVFLTVQKDSYVFGKIISSKIYEEEVPFLFKTLDTAKDYVSICPEIKKIDIRNVECDTSVTYKTYELSLNKNIIGYIEWNANCVHKHDNRCHITFYVDDEFPIVYKFAKNINPSYWENTWSVSNIKFDFDYELLTELVKKYNNEETVLEEYKYSLVQEQS